MRVLFILTMVLAVAWVAVPGAAEESLTALNTEVVFDFSGFTGAGFDPNPAAGQLDSGNWATEGWSDGSVDFGGSANSGDFARGSSAGGVVSGGIYAFDIGGGNIALGIQPGSSDFTPGSITLRLRNDTGVAVHKIRYAYKLYAYNDQPRANLLKGQWSTDGVNFFDITSGFTSTEGADVSPSWNMGEGISGSVAGPPGWIPDGSYVYLRFTGDDVSGSGSRDEFAIDDVRMSVVPEPAALALLGLGAFLIRRRR